MLLTVLFYVVVGLLLRVVLLVVVALLVRRDEVCSVGLFGSLSSALSIASLACWCSRVCMVIVVIVVIGSWNERVSVGFGLLR